ncbi:hypothetical protein ACUIJQ_02535 [Levilactobacillus hammesii]|uniref:hypothetical protein n=1 Tax=Levilactobacillus hammesii TaxID=267633 RepID=UPI000A7B68F7|nr:hypothetical protein [Levilactobacillus hammesii]
MRNRMVLGTIVVLSLTLVACARDSTNEQRGDIAFGQMGKTARTQVWYIAKSQNEPSLKMPLKSIVITQNGKATAFQVPSSFTLGDAARLSIQQLKQKGMALSKQAFTHKRQALMTDTKEKLSVEKENLKKDQKATVVSFAAVKSDRRIVAGYQGLRSRIENAKFKQPRPLPFSVDLEKKNGHVTQEMLNVDTYDFEKSYRDTSSQSVNYRRISHQVFASPYTGISAKSVKLGNHYFGYYRHAGRHPAYALTKVVSQKANVKFDAASIK